MAARWVLHDLRSPAQSLTLMADLMADPSGDLEEILREACSHLARSLDLLSRVVHPPPAGEIGPISVREPIAFITDLQRAGRTHVRIELAVDPSLPAAAGVDRHVEHALLNLVIYATEALGPQDSGIIRISATAEGDQVRITVGWDGPPLPPEQVAQLFELPPETFPGEQPLSVGLPVAREVLRLCGGTLGYAEGCPAPCFRIILPLWRRAAAPGWSAGSR